MNKKDKVLSILKQELNISGWPAEKTASIIVNALEYKKRSGNQNNYYWGVIIEYSREFFGYTAEEMHEAFKWQFLRQGSPELPTVRSTASKEFTTEDAEKYYEQIRVFMSEYGVVIPLPNES